MPNVPKAMNLKPGAVVRTPPVPGGPPITASPGDVVVNGSAGWHIITGSGPVNVPVGGWPAGQSSDQYHWSTGASYSGMGVPQPAGSTFDQIASGVGSDGRAASSDGTIGGAPGVVSGGVSGQATSGAANTGGGGGSPSRAY